jgi:hypothetical protein
MKNILIDDWHKCLAFFSVKAMTLGTAISASYGAFYPQLKDTLPPNVMAYITAAIFVIGIAARLINQSPNNQTENNDK